MRVSNTTSAESNTKRTIELTWRTPSDAVLFGCGVLLRSIDIPSRRAVLFQLNKELRDATKNQVNETDPRQLKIPCM